MLVLIDETGLPWAKHYYNMFPFEPSRRREDDIRFTPADMQFLKHPYLIDVLKAMVRAGEKGEKEIMLVAHGNKDGLVMKIAPHIQFSAAVETLDAILIAVEAFDVIDSSANMPKNMAQLTAWARIAARLDAGADEARVQALTTSRVAEELRNANNDVAKACLDFGKRLTDFVLKDPQGLVKRMHTTEHALREVADLTAKVRDVAFSRFELRACNIGDGDGIAALRSFFNATRLMAPKVHTFYVAVNAPDNPAKVLEVFAKSVGPRWREFSSPSFQVPLEKPRMPYIKPFIDPPMATIIGSVNFMLSVTPIQTPLYMSEARRLNAGAAKEWVTKFIHPSAIYSGRGHLFAAGLDSPTPTHEPYTLPQDPSYRSLIATATVTGVER